MKKAPKKVFILWGEDGSANAVYTSIKDLKEDGEDPKTFVAYTIVVKEAK